MDASPLLKKLFVDRAIIQILIPLLSEWVGIVDLARLVTQKITIDSIISISLLSSYIRMRRFVMSQSGPDIFPFFGINLSYAQG